MDNHFSVSPIDHERNQPHSLQQQHPHLNFHHFTHQHHRQYHEILQSGVKMMNFSQQQPPSHLDHHPTQQNETLHDRQQQPNMLVSSKHNDINTMQHFNSDSGGVRVGSGGGGLSDDNNNNIDNFIHDTHKRKIKEIPSLNMMMHQHEHQNAFSSLDVEQRQQQHTQSPPQPPRRSASFGSNVVKPSATVLRSQMYNNNTQQQPTIHSHNFSDNKLHSRAEHIVKTHSIGRQDDTSGIDENRVLISQQQLNSGSAQADVDEYHLTKSDEAELSHNHRTDNKQTNSMRIINNSDGHHVRASAGSSSDAFGDSSSTGGGGSGTTTQGVSLKTISPAKHQAVVAHLNAQIQFLHSEVDRMEAAADKIKDKCAVDAQSQLQRFTSLLEQRDKEIDTLSHEVHKWRSGQLSYRGGPFPGGDPDDEDEKAAMLNPFARIKQLQAELSNAIAEKKAAQQEKFDALGKMRKAEEKLRINRIHSEQVELQVDENMNVSDQQRKILQETISELAADRDRLISQLAVMKIKHRIHQQPQPVATEGTQTDAADAEADDGKMGEQNSTTISQLSSVMVTADASKQALTLANDKMCQVETLTAAMVTCGASREGGMMMPFEQHGSGNAVQGLAHALEMKCSELDTLRSRCDELEGQKEHLQLQAQQLREAYSDESTRRRQTEEELERAQLKLRALQQQSSQLQVLVRDRDESVRAAEQRMQDAVNAAARAAEERKVWEEQIATNAHDLQLLVQQQNVASAQVQQTAAENEQLQDEVRKLLQREAQVSYLLRSKEVEINEVLAMYQQTVREKEAQVQNIVVLEREADNLRAAVATKEERLAEAHHQIDSLAQREQQLCLDLQTVDYENTVLHGKLVSFEQETISSQSAEKGVRGQLESLQKVCEEYERRNADQNKQLVLKEHQLMLFRRRVDEVEREVQGYRSEQQQLVTRLRETEDENARLVVRGVMASIPSSSTAISHRAQKSRSSADNSNQPCDDESLSEPCKTATADNDEDEKNKIIRQLKDALTTANAVLESEQITVQMLRRELEQRKKGGKS